MAIEQEKGVILERKITHINPKSHVTFAPISAADCDRRTIDVPKDKIPHVFDFDDKKEILKYKGSLTAAQVGDIVSLYIPDLKENTAPIILGFQKEEAPDGVKSLARESNFINSFQLGSSLLYVPPLQIRVDKMSTTKRMPTIRSKGSIKSQTGHTDTRITISIFFPDTSSVNDPKDGLRAIIAQFMRTPFVPIINNYLNFVHHIDAVCLHDISVSTVPNFPQSLEVTLTMFAFEYMAFMPQEPSFLDTIDADLYTWYCQKGLLNGGKDGLGKLRPVLRKRSNIVFTAVPEDEIVKLQNNRQKKSKLISESQNIQNFKESFYKAIHDLETYEAAMRAMEEFKRTKLTKTIERVDYKLTPENFYYKEGDSNVHTPGERTIYEIASGKDTSNDQRITISIKLNHEANIEVLGNNSTDEKETWVSITWDSKEGWMALKGFGGEQRYSGPVGRGMSIPVWFPSSYQKNRLENTIRDTYNNYVQNLSGDVRTKLESQIQDNINVLAMLKEVNDSYESSAVDRVAFSNATKKAEKLAFENDLRRTKGEFEPDREVPSKSEEEKGIKYFVSKENSTTYYCFVKFQNPDNQAAGKKLKEAGVLTFLGNLYTSFDACVAYRKVNGKWQWSKDKERLHASLNARFEATKAQHKYTDHKFDGYLSSIIPEPEADVIPEPVYDEWELDNSNVVVTDVQVSYQNTFSRLPFQNYEMPAFQFLGAQDVYAKISMEVLNDSALEQLQSLYEYCQRIARSYRYDAIYSYVRVKNEILQLFGVEDVFIDSLTCSTVPNFPGRYFVEMTLMDYDVMQSSRENGEIISMSGEEPVIITDPKNNPVKNTPGYTIWMKHTPKDGNVQEQIYWMKVEKLLNNINLYPDLDLPTCKEVNDFLKSIGRKPLYVNTDRVYVDPDFYFVPQNTLAQITKNILDGGPALTIHTRDRSGKKVSQNIISGRTSVNIGQNTIFGTDPADLATKNEVESVKKKGSTIKYGPEAQDPKNQWGNEWHDQIKWDCTGRMVRAFPTAHIFLVDEGSRLGWYRLWDNFYGMNAMSGIEIIRSRKIAADTAFITVSNTYHRFTERRFDYKDSHGRDIAFNLNRFFRMSIDKTMKQAQADIQEQTGLFAGARLHIRMGYGNSLSELPILFNGTITEVGVGEVVNIVAQSDAIELTNLLNYKEGTVGGFLQGGVEPTVLLLKLLERGDKQGISYAWDVIKTNWQRAADNPVQHFGVPNFFVGFMTSGGELGQNIYRANGTGVGIHGEPMVDVELSNKTIWDVSQLLSLYVPNYISVVHPFEFRSTLFYGKPDWDLTYGYEISATEKPGFVEAREWADHTGRKLGYWIKAKKKPYRQWHVYSSFGHIIDNRVKVSSEGMYHNVIGRYRADKPIGEPYDAQVIMHADRDIYPNIQKTTSVECELLVKKPFPWPVVGMITGALTWYKEKTMTWKWAQNLCASVIRDYMKDMYQGELIIIGDPTVKPYDAIHINDTYEEMFGNCFVKEVVHQFSLDTGFITMVSPDAAVAVVDDQNIDIFCWGAAAAVGTALTWSMTTKGAGSIRAFGFVKGAEYARTTAGLLLKSSRGIRNLKASLSIGKTTLSTAKAAKGAYTLTKATLLGSKALAATGAAAAAAGPPGWVVLAIEASLVIATDVLFAYIERWAREQSDCVIINLLKYRGREFSAGINGHKGITAGTLGGTHERRFWDTIVGAMPTWVRNLFNMQEPNISPETIYGDVSEETRQLLFDSATFIWPADGVITSTFGKRRPPYLGIDPKTKKPTYGTDAHGGIDISNSLNTPIYAVADGQAIDVDTVDDSPSGIYIKIDHGDTITCYCHLNKVDQSVVKNGYVHQGQIIGYMGNTGGSSGVHLHFGVYDKYSGKYVYPYDYLSETGMLSFKPGKVEVDRGTGKIVNVL
jgi:hypothetical protein